MLLSGENNLPDYKYVEYPLSNFKFNLNQIL